MEKSKESKELEEVRKLHKVDESDESDDDGISYSYIIPTKLFWQLVEIYDGEDFNIQSCVEEQKHNTSPQIKMHCNDLYILLEYMSKAGKNKPKITQEICNEIIEVEGWFLCYIPVEFRTEKLCLSAIRKSSRTLAQVPIDVMTYEMCLISVSKVGRNLNHVPPKFMSYEICDIATKDDDVALFFLPQKYDQDVFVERAKRWVFDNYVAYHLPQHLLEKMDIPAIRFEKECNDICEYAKNSHFCLGTVAETFKTADVCKTAVINNGYNIKYVPKQHITSELCEIAVDNHPLAITCIPDKFATIGLCDKACKKYGVTR